MLYQVGQVVSPTHPNADCVAIRGGSPGWGAATRQRIDSPNRCRAVRSRARH